MENVQQEFETDLMESYFNRVSIITLKKYIFIMTDDEIKLFYDDAKRLINDR